MVEMADCETLSSVLHAQSTAWAVCCQAADQVWFGTLPTDPHQPQRLTGTSSSGASPLEHFFLGPAWELDLPD